MTVSLSVLTSSSSSCFGFSLKACEFAWMDSSSAQHQAMGTHSLEDVIACAKPQQDQRRLIRPQPEQLKCPRCDSANTKFCYYNNYSLSQPRYFCKACRRYWTKGGSLRNVPVGGGCRKNNKRSSSSSSGKRSSSQEVLSTNSNPLPSLFPSLSYDTNDLTLAFGNLHKQPSRQLRLDDHGNSILGNLNTTHFDHIIGNPNTTANTNAGYAGGYLETPNGYLHNFYYGYGNGNMGEVDQGCGGSGSHEEMVLPYEDMSAGATTTATTTTAATITTTTKQEFYNGSRDGENRMFLNFPWQFNGEGNMENVDSSGRECWNNGLGSSSWHGLVNSSLM